MINSFWDLKNADDLEDELVEMLMQFDIDTPDFENDIYLYVDEDTMTGELDIFPNPGGHSWLDDDHYLLCEIQSYHSDWTDGWQTIGDIAGQIGLTPEELKREVLDNYLNFGVEPDAQWDIDDVDYSDIVDYIESSGKYIDKIYEELDNIVRENRGDYYEKAVEIIDVFDEGLANAREERNRKWW